MDNSQPEFDQEKYERFIQVQVGKSLSSFEERIYLIMRHYPAYDLEKAMELDAADATAMAKSALISQHQATLNMLSILAASHDEKSYKKMQSAIQKAIKELKK